jgi:hypothetical protein
MPIHHFALFAVYGLYLNKHIAFQFSLHANKPLQLLHHLLIQSINTGKLLIDLRFKLLKIVADTSQ